MTAGLVYFVFAQFREGPGRGAALDAGPSALLIAAIVLLVLPLFAGAAFLITRRRRARDRSSR